MKHNQRGSNSCLMLLIGTILVFSELSLASGLNDLDKAKSVKEIRSSQSELKNESKDSLIGYARNQQNEGRKRYIALASACKQMSEDDGVSAVQDIFEHETDKDLRVSCAIWIGDRKTNEKARNALKKAFKNDKEDKAVRAALAIGLATMGDDSGKDVALKAILNSEYFADFGMLALERLKAKDVLSTLRTNRKNSSDYWVQNHCRIAELRIEMSTASETERISLLHSVLTEDGYFHARLWAGKRLGEMGGDAARDVLSAVARDTKSPGQYAASKGLMVGIKAEKWTPDDLRGWLRK